MKKIVIHPFLFAIFPILSLYSHNKDMVQPSYLLWPLIISLLFAVILFWGLKKIFKNSNKTAIIISLIVMLFFSFGHFLKTISDIEIGKIVIYNYVILILIWLIILISAILIILKSNKTLNTFTARLNIIGAFLVLLPLISIGAYEYKEENLLKNIEAENYNIEINGKNNLPDIYYLIFDGYGRSDVLKEIYNYDNSDFINYLTEKGFYVADQSTANYPQSYISISSSLNFKYINYLSNTVGKESSDRKPLAKMIENSKVYGTLDKAGYVFVGFPSSFSGYKNFQADIYMKNKMDLNEFDIILINTTPIGLILGGENQLNFYRKKILYSFDKLPEITKISSPTFTYVHFLTPHPPFAFDANGQPANPKVSKVSGLDGSHYFQVNPNKEEYRERYKKAITFVNKKLIKTIDEIIDKSNTPPIIILQSDHGPGSELDWESVEKTNMKERFSILNAYYMPKEAREQLYKSITPVNTFRVVFNYIFDNNLELLENKNYFAKWSRPYDFIDVTEEVN